MPARLTPNAFRPLFGFALGTLLLSTIYSTPAAAAEFFPIDIDLSGARRVSFNTKAISVSEDGSVVVATSAGLDTIGRPSPGDLIRWTLASGPKVLATQVRPGATVSGDGNKIAGNFYRRGDDASDYTPFLITDGVLTELPILDGRTIVTVRAISLDGSTIVGISGPTNDSFPTTVWVDGQPSELPTTGVYDVSGDGSIVLGAGVGNPDFPIGGNFISFWAFAAVDPRRDRTAPASHRA